MVRRGSFIPISLCQDAIPLNNSKMSAVWFGFGSLFFFFLQDFPFSFFFPFSDELSLLKHASTLMVRCVTEVGISTVSNHDFICLSNRNHFKKLNSILKIQKYCLQ